MHEHDLRCRSYLPLPYRAETRKLMFGNLLLVFNFPPLSFRASMEHWSPGVTSKRSLSGVPALSHNPSKMSTCAHCHWLTQYSLHLCWARFLLGDPERFAPYHCHFHEDWEKSQFFSCSIRYRYLGHIVVQVQAQEDF